MTQDSNLKQPPKARPLEEVKAEYSKLVFAYGHLNFEITCKTKDLEMMERQLRDLNFEYLQARNQAAVDAKKAAEQTPVQPGEPALALTEVK